MPIPASNCSVSGIEKELSVKRSLTELTVMLPLRTAISISSINASAFRDELLSGSNSGVIKRVEGNISC